MDGQVMNDQDKIADIEEHYEWGVENGFADRGLSDDQVIWLIGMAKNAIKMGRLLDAECEDGYKMEGRLHDANGRIGKLTEALEFYSDESNYQFSLMDKTPTSDQLPMVCLDGGKRARDVLGKQ